MTHKYNNTINKSIILCMTLLLLNISAFSQETHSISADELTLEQIKGLTQDDLLQFEFEDLIHLVKKFKLSSIEELYALLLNPSQSTASKMDEDVFDTPLATTVITAKELERSGATSIPEALKLAPGLIVREKTNGNYDVHIRGNDYIPPGSDFSNTVNSTTLVMIDNRPVYNSFLGATFWETLPVTVNDIDKIEIIYGPSAALYGPNAVSGVIHLITKKVNTEGVSTNFDIQGGNNNSKIAYGSVGYNKGDWGINVSGNYQKTDRFQDTYYNTRDGEYISGELVGEINALEDTTYNADEFSSDYANAKNQGAVNMSINYSPSEKLNINYTGAYQSSSVQTAYMDLGSVLSTRQSSSFSNSINITSGKFDAHFSSVFGKLNAIEGLPGYEYDYKELNGKLGYNFQYKNLLIRPGIDANYAYYSDENYIDSDTNAGLLNGSAELGTVQGSLRLDYTAFSKLRIVGAWMQGHFYKPERSYSSYQFSTSYKANENTLLRMVVSKSNSSPFVLNTYMNKTLQISAPNNDPNNSSSQYMTLNKVGNEDLDPQEMRTIEFGIRHKLMKNLQADVSLFYNKSDNYSQLVNEQSEMSPPSENTGSGSEAPNENQNKTRIITESMQNMDLEASQLGLTASLKYVMNEKFNATLFATYQNTKLDNYEVSSAKLYEGLTGETIDGPTIATESEYLSLDHDYTPNFYGGANINYAPTKKWNFNTSIYGYGKQKSFYTKGPEYYDIEIGSKLTCNLKASYQLNRFMNVYVNARNISNNKTREFMYTDKSGGTYLLGLNIKL